MAAKADNEWFKGEFVVENYKGGLVSLAYKGDGSEPEYSEPIIVEGVIYRLEVYRNGNK